MAHPQPRVRLTISLARDIAEQVDDLVDGVRIRNRSHAVESLLLESLHLAQVRQAVIMAGGDDVAKRLPAIQAMLKTLKVQGIYDIYLAVGYLADVVKETFQHGEQLGLRIQYLESNLGTGGVLREHRGKFKGNFLVINIERPIEIDIKQLLTFHREHQPLVTIATPSLKDLHGVYVFEPKALSFIPDGFVMLEETVFHELTKAGKLLPYPIVTER